MTYADIHQQIKHSIRILVKVGIEGYDFIRGMYTVRVTASYGKLKYITYCKVADELQDFPLTYLEEEAVKPIWRIDRKRVAHGLEPWFKYG